MHSPQISLCLLLSLLLSLILSAASSSPACPTVSITTHRPSCLSLTPAFCAQPECILLSMLDVPCGCPTNVPTRTTYTACPTVCQGRCGTAYETNIASCTTSPKSSSSSTSSKPTTISTSIVPSSCITITQTTGSACPTFTGCTTENCIELKTVTQPCGCPSVKTQTACATGCRLACATSYDVVYIPCPLSATSSPVSIVTTGGDVTTTRTGVILMTPTAY